MEHAPAEPFVLRPHHIAYLSSPGELSPTDAADMIVGRIESVRGDARPETVRLDAEEMDLPTYGVDVLGGAPAQRQTFYNGILDTLTQFQLLPDDAPLRLAAGVKDAICKSCAFGNHCGLPENKALDLRFLDDIKEVATDIGYMDKIVAGHDESTPDLRWFDTDAGTLRAILLCLRYGYIDDEE